MRRARDCVIDGRTGARSTDVQTRMYFRFIATLVSYWLRMPVYPAAQISKSAPSVAGVQPCRRRRDPWIFATVIFPCFPSFYLIFYEPRDVTLA